MPFRHQERTHAIARVECVECEANACASMHSPMCASMHSPSASVISLILLPASILLPHDPLAFAVQGLEGLVQIRFHVMSCVPLPTTRLELSRLAFRLSFMV